MKANTIVSLAIKHVGEAGSQVECFTGTFAECVTGLAKYLGPISMATRFDMCLARSPEEARRGLTIGKAREKTTFPDEFDLGALESLMNQGEGGNDESE